jgi:hypothetical protein
VHKRAHPCKRKSREWSRMSRALLEWDRWPGVQLQSSGTAPTWYSLTFLTELRPEGSYGRLDRYTPPRLKHTMVLVHVNEY